MYVLINPRVKTMMLGEPPIMFFYLRLHPTFFFELRLGLLILTDLTIYP